MPNEGFKHLSIRDETYDQLEVIRRATGERSLSAAISLLVENYQVEENNAKIANKKRPLSGFDRQPIVFFEETEETNEVNDFYEFIPKIPRKLNPEPAIFTA
jgi:predicted CopG family antitoxin